MRPTITVREVVEWGALLVLTLWALVILIGI